MTEKWTEGKKNCDIRFFIFFLHWLTGKVSAETGKSDNAKLSSQFSRDALQGSWQVAIFARKKKCC